MPARRSGLGRGLEALIPRAEPADRSSLREVPLASIRANQFQPRRHFDEEALSSLVDSIKVVGVLQPVLLREVGEGEYELIAGERRCRAARRAGLQAVPALVQPASDSSSLEQALIENLHREDLNVLEEAAAYKQLIEEFELTHDEVARRVGRSRAAISNSLRLFQLPPGVQRLVRDRALSAGHARALLGTPDRAVQETLAQRAIEEGWSVRAVEELVRASLRGPEAPRSSAGTPADGNAGAPLIGEGLHAEGLRSADEQRPPDSPESGTSPAAELVRVTEPGFEDGEEQIGGGTSRAPDGASRRGASAGTTTRPEAGGASSFAGQPPGVLELEELLADYLNTRVRVDMGARHGRLVVEFATLDDLERIYRLMIGPSSS